VVHADFTAVLGSGWTSDADAELMLPVHSMLIMPRIHVSPVLMLESESRAAGVHAEGR
jgi:hypothetical protein